MIFTNKFPCYGMFVPPPRQKKSKIKLKERHLRNITDFGNLFRQKTMVTVDLKRRSQQTVLELRISNVFNKMLCPRLIEIRVDGLMGLLRVGAEVLCPLETHKVEQVFRYHMHLPGCFFLHF